MEQIEPNKKNASKKNIIEFLSEGALIIFIILSTTNGAFAIVAINPKLAAIRICEMKWDGDNVYGKAIVLNTSEGQIVKALLEGGGRLGVSTRALGEVESKGNYSRVTKLLLNAVDVVNTPSGQDCYVNSLTESANWILNESGIWMQEQMSKGKNVDISSFLQYTEDAIRKLKL